MVKWAILDPCSGLSESDPKIYTNIEFDEIEIHEHLKTYVSTKPSKFCSQKTISNNVYRF